MPQRSLGRVTCRHSDLGKVVFDGLRKDFKQSRIIVHKKDFVETLEVVSHPIERLRFLTSEEKSTEA